MTELTAPWAEPVRQGLRAWRAGQLLTWVEGDRQTYGEPRNPYHRVDTVPSSRHVQVLPGQAIVAETSRPVLPIETGVGIIVDGTPEAQP